MLLQDPPLAPDLTLLFSYVARQHRIPVHVSRAPPAACSRPHRSYQVGSFGQRGLPAGPPPVYATTLAPLGRGGRLQCVLYGLEGCGQRHPMTSLCPPRVAGASSTHSRNVLSCLKRRCLNFRKITKLFLAAQRPNIALPVHRSRRPPVMIAAIKRRRIDSPYTTAADMAKFGPRFPVSRCYLCCSQI